MSVLHEICLCTSLTFHSGLGSIKHLRDDANDCDLDPEDTLSDALIDEGKAQVDNSDQNVIISVIQEQTRKTENAPTIENSTPASSSIIARPSAAQISVPRFEDIESPLGKRKRVPSSEYDDRGEHQHGSVQRRKTQRSKNSRASIASESKSQPTQLASPSHGSMSTVVFLRTREPGKHQKRDKDVPCYNRPSRGHSHMPTATGKHTQVMQRMLRTIICNMMMRVSQTCPHLSCDAYFVHPPCRL